MPSSWATLLVWRSLHSAKQLCALSRAAKRTVISPFSPDFFHELFTPANRNTPYIELSFVWREIVQVGWINRNINKKPKVQQNSNKNLPVSWALKNLSCLQILWCMHTSIFPMAISPALLAWNFFSWKEIWGKSLFLRKKDRAVFVWIHKR